MLMAENKKTTKEQPLKTCFVIMPISDCPDYSAGHFNRVFKHIIVPACQKLGYQAVRADETSKTNVIITEILKNILECDMAICDLSSRNPNVFYELGFRQAFDKKTVLMIDEKTERPFDISPIRSFKYSSTLRIDLVNKAVDDLVKALQETQIMTDGEPNSLLKLLAIDTPAKLPKKQELNADSTLILQAIKDLADKLRPNIYLKPDSKAKSHKSIFLPSGDLVKIGAHLYDRKENQERGEVIDIADDNLVLRNLDGAIEFLNLLEPKAQNLIVLPF